jgi:hypothetical protein
MASRYYPLIHPPLHARVRLDELHPAPAAAVDAES